MLKLKSVQSYPGLQYVFCWDSFFALGNVLFPRLHLFVEFSSGVRYGYDSDSNHESTQNQIFFAWVMSWFCVNSWKTTWLMNGIDSSLRDTAWVMSWFESRHLTNAKKKHQWNWAKAQKKLTKLSEIPNPKKSTKYSENTKKVNEISIWFESLSHDLIRINIPESFLSHESICIKILNYFKVIVDLNQNILEYKLNISE